MRSFFSAPELHEKLQSYKTARRYPLSRFFQHIAPVLLSAAIMLLLAGSPGAHAQSLPHGGHYVAGSGSIATSGAAMTITQSSTRGIINWQGFSIGSANKVQFNNGAGATLNQVLGGNLSTIEGELTATGSVYLINPNGVVVGPSGKVITGGSFIGSTLGVPDQQFMQGGALEFSNGSGGPNGAVINNGKIVSQNGNVALIGYSATNAGSILAPAGTVTLAAGAQVLLLPLNGPAGIYVATGQPGTSGNATNSGQIKAAAAALESAGGNVYELAGNQSGLISATGTQIINGQVWLTAPAGTVSVSGTVEAQNVNGSGGVIIAKGQNVELGAGSVLNAAGATGHGQIETSGQSVSVGGATVTAGLGGTWTVDPIDLTIDSTAASTIDSSLNGGTSVTEQTTATGASGSGTQASGAGDINVDAAISWSSSAGLTLSAYNSINVAAPITASGSGALTLTTNNNVGGTSSGGALNFAMGLGNIRFTGTGGSLGSLTINGAAYTLIQNMTELQSTGSTGYYALAENLNATGVTGFTPIGQSTAFTGTFNGLGHTVSNLVISSTSFSEVGLFAQVGSGGVVENIGLAGGSVTDANAFGLGGLAGYNEGTITNSYETGAVTSGSGGMGSEAGGLVGYNYGTISRSYATGAVSDGTGFGGNLLGGLVGYNNGAITESYATGTLTGTSHDESGGLVGRSSTGTISDSYATGAVITGSNGGAGGLVGYNFSPITDAYATGAVSGSSALVGGLVGYNSSPITDAYAAGKVSDSGSGSSVGGFVGYYNNGTITASYWDTTTSGTTTGIGVGSSTGATGLTTEDWLTQGPVATGAWDTTNTWVAGYPYPVLKALPYVLVTGSAASQTYGSITTPSISISSITDQKGNNATSLVNTSGLAWIDLVSSTSNAGSYNLGGQGATVSSGYQLTYNGTLTVNPATLTAALTGTVSKTYDGTTAATLAPGNYTLNGVMGSDQVTLNDPTSGSYASQNVGTGIAVTASGLTLSGTAAGNYTLASATATGNIGTITPAGLTAALTGTVSKAYDGTTAATLAPGNYALSGVIGSDHVTLNDPTSGSYASQNVDTGIAVTAGGLTLSGAAAGNYTLASATATGNIGTITPASLTAALTGTVSKTYDGTTAATLAPGNYSLTGVIGTDQVTLNDPASGVYASQNAGTAIPVSVNGLALLGVDASNYVLAASLITSDVGVITSAMPTAMPLLPFITALPWPAPANGVDMLLLVGPGNGFGPLPAILLPADTMRTIINPESISVSTGQSLVAGPEQTLTTAGGVRHLKINLPEIGNRQQVSESWKAGGQQ